MARSSTSRGSSKKRTPSPPPPTWDEQLINSLIPWRLEIAGLALFLLAMITLFALPGLTRANWLRWWTSLWRQLVGWGAYPLWASLAAAGLYVVLRKVEKPFQIRVAQVIGFELILLTALPLSYQLGEKTLADAHLGLGGGLFGWALSEPLVDFVGPFLTGSFYLGFMLWGLALILQLDWDDLLSFLQGASGRLRDWSEKIAPAQPALVVYGTPDGEHSAHGLQEPVSPVTTSTETAGDRPYILDISAEAGASRQRRRDKRLPPLTILHDGGFAALPEDEVEKKSAIIEQTLLDFGLPAKVTEVRRGPAITQFGVEPGYVERSGPDGQLKQQKVRVGQIASLQKDLTLALAAPRIRIEAPIPGRSVVGVEVPNDEISLVRLRPILESDIFLQVRGSLAVALGRDVSGTPVATDLSRLPHLLIAGTTGSGKSVCINAFITCLVINNAPEQLRLIMIDPKKVELIRFNGLPHLIGNVEVEADRAVGVLRWLTAEMDRRYELFAGASARNLNGYNRKVGRRSGQQLPHIAVFIDELADLMHMYPGDIERTLCRLAQMARATGIHLVVATQRPSTDVITGLIKANFPARLSFAVASGTDSRVILDVIGAENLLGRGDMLFLPPDEGSPARVQGVFVNDIEIEGVVEHWRKSMPDEEPEPPPWENLIARHALIDETDTLLEAAIELAQKYDHISASFLQRRLRLGYPRAARLMEHLYEMGLVEDPKTGGRTRRTLIDEEDDPLEELLSGQDD